MGGPVLAVSAALIRRRTGLPTIGLGPEIRPLAYTVSAFHRDRSGTLWLGTWGGVLIRFDEKTNTFMNYPPDPRDPRRLQGGSIGAIHEDRAGTLWLASGQGLYRV